MTNPSATFEYINGKDYWGNSSFNAVPGEYDVTVATFHGGVVLRENFRRQRYIFNVDAGKKYLINGDEIQVMDRFDRNNRFETLHLIPGNMHVYGTKEQAKKMLEQRQQDRLNQLKLDKAKEEATREMRKTNLHNVRKIGARVCKSVANVSYVGFVEGMSNEKIQIRVSDAYILGAPNARPSDFSPSIIWENHLAWEACE